jgi:hypothetical protein
MLRAFEVFLTKKGAVKTQNAPYYLKWVSDCYSFLNEPLSNRVSSEQKKQFLSDIAKRYEDWQVKQADTAMRLYDYFLSNDLKPSINIFSSYEEHWRFRISVIL